MKIAVAVKMVDRRPEIDPITAQVSTSARTAGASDADRAAVMWALRCREQWGGTVTIATAGPPATEELLRRLMAFGADDAVRVDLPAGAPSLAVANGLALALEGTDLVWCGDASIDRGSGSVPAYLAGRLGRALALGLLAIDVGPPGELVVTRRLDGGRREQLRVRVPAVVSVEGSTARPMRPSLASQLAVPSFPVHVVAGPRTAVHTSAVARPFRPRPRALAAPHGATARDRIAELTAAHAASAGHTEAVQLEPAEAADLILATLRAWGELPSPAGPPA
jgi:electron transfer flavoprotein beta subunit